MASKPIDVVVFRAIQECAHLCLHHFGGWRRLGKFAEALPLPSLEPTILAKYIPTLSSEQRNTLKASSAKVVAFEFEVFGHRVPALDELDFSEDWRFGHRWQSKYFKDYSFYEHKEIPYDVKLPWELSRLAFLVPVLTHQVVEGANPDSVTWVSEILECWDMENPLGYSVNWYPMEASMRAVNLSLLLDLTRLALKSTTDEAIFTKLQELLVLTAKLLYKNAAFVWRTREYTDVRGNHYTANLVALYLAGSALAGMTRESARWKRFARARLEQEIQLQFCADGVNFEKACSYHKLVLELFALAGIAAENAREPFTPASLELLEKAADFSDAITRPDGLAANFGDTDDACAIPFFMGPPRSHGAIVEVLRAWRGKSLGWARFDENEGVAALFLTGKPPPVPAEVKTPEIHAFKEGGYFIARDQSQGFFFMADMGEVGMRGRGGHGHNDLLSFELFIDGKAIVLDPGCSGYTSDLDKKAQFRSTAAHATPQLFGAEMADMTSHWAISAHATPKHVAFRYSDDGFTVSACHEGYSRLYAGTTVCREFTVSPRQQLVSITDEIRTPVEGAQVVWRFPVGSADIQLQISEGVRSAVIEPAAVSAESGLKIERAPFSNGYAQEEVGQVLVSEALLKHGGSQFSFTIKRQETEVSE